MEVEEKAGGGKKYGSRVVEEDEGNFVLSFCLCRCSKKT